MRPQEIIERKRDGRKLGRKDIDAFIDGVCDGSWADYQIAALVMAMFINGLDPEEQEALVYAMLHSGEILDLSGIKTPKADKHSTGGVGDKTSLIIAPLVAACGVAVPMISGRGLGHTGGTLDKLESIPGFNVNLSTEEFRRIIDKCGYAMAGQTADIAPADKKLYALRDATATVAYIPLIVGSIMSKKLAEGLDALVLDVKTGSGAFMQSIEDSKNLAKALVNTGKQFGVRTQAVVSDMSQPLGEYVGNAMEVYECICILRNEVGELMLPTRDLSIDLAVRMLYLSGSVGDLSEAKKLIEQKLTDGSGLERFRQNVELQGGDIRVCDEPSLLIDPALVECSITSEVSGIVTEFDTLAFGNAMVDIGGGRVKAEDPVDAAVGIRLRRIVGDASKSGEPLAIAYCRNAEQAEILTERVRSAFKISNNVPVVKPKLIQAVIDE
jgi:pyrimidine-nucleoside phosphorylase